MKKCPSCNQGNIQPTAKPNRTWRYRGLDLDVPEDFEIPTCDRCDEEWLDNSLIDRLDKILRDQWKSRLFALVARASSILDLPEQVLKNMKKEDAPLDLFLQTFIYLDTLVGNDGEKAKLWMNNENEHLGGKPVDLIQNFEGAFRVMKYLNTMVEKP